MATRHRLSKHFTVEEFDCHDGTKVRQRDYRGLTYLCAVFLEPMREKWGPVHVNSGFRTKSYNASIGGASQSYHVYPEHDGRDQAVDITCKRGNSRDWHRTANAIREKRRNGRGGLGLYSSFVHIDIRDYKSDWKG